jgi:hypothetical protein
MLMHALTALRKAMQLDDNPIADRKRWSWTGLPIRMPTNIPRFFRQAKLFTRASCLAFTEIGPRWVRDAPLHRHANSIRESRDESPPATKADAKTDVQQADR